MTLSKLLAVALLAPAVAFAAPTTGTKTTKTSKTSSSTSTARPASSGTSSSTSGTPLEGLEVGGFIGYETADLSGLSLRLDGEVPFRELSPQVKLSLVGSFGYSHLTWDPVPWAKFTANVFKFVPAARFTLPLNEQFSVFGDAGLGLAYIRASVDFDGFTGLGSASASSINLMMRLGVGAWYHVNPQLKLGAMLELDPVFGDYGYAGNGIGKSQNTFLIQFGGMFKI
jgi:opacity protein-like surface antigen